MEKFQTFWHGESLPAYQALAAKSFVDHGHEYILYTYDTLAVPNGVEVRDAREILPESEVFFYGQRAGSGRGSVSSFSNVFRYELLAKQGNWWVDADVVCLSGAVPKGEVFLGWEYPRLIGSAILKLPQGHILAQSLSNAARSKGTDVGWGDTGPVLVTKMAQENGLLEQTYSQPYAYPIQSCNALDLLLPDQSIAVWATVQECPFLHLWNEIQRRATIHPAIAPPSGSVLSDLCDRHGITHQSAIRYRVDLVERLRENLLLTEPWLQSIVDPRRLPERVLEAKRRAEEVEKERESLRVRAESALQEIEHLKQRITSFERSTSWRASAPLRWIGSCLPTRRVRSKRA